MTTPSNAAADALRCLTDGNARDVADDPIPQNTTRQWRLEVAQAQFPFATLAGCSGSRVGP